MGNGRDPWRGEAGAFAYLSEGDPEPDSTPTDVRERVSDIVDTGDPAFISICSAAMHLLKYGFDITDPDIARRCIAVGRASHQTGIDRDAALVRRGEQPLMSPLRREASEVVYYMRIGNRVKIGWSRNLPKRLATINPEELMVTEPGNSILERVRHDQFSALHTHGEWFRLEQPLTDHITELREIDARHSRPEAAPGEVHCAP